ncbi:MAG: amidohydrolase family protein [Dehalococcoidia bacterium]|nr:amidohydrolase family protein [Dehalococcoidia bacterium]
MADKTRPWVIALEEHYWDSEVVSHFAGESRAPNIVQRLEDMDALRLKEMDEAGIDLQVISHGPPGTQRLNPEIAAEVSIRANDRLRDAIAARPDRFAAFASLPTVDPTAAADELERTVTRLGFKGALIHGLTNGVFLDDKRFWPIFERAQALDVPLYVHPSSPHPAVVDIYYRDYLQDFPSLLGAGWGFTVETATQDIRLVLSGVFEEYPNLKIILGHLGESLPFSLWRIDHAPPAPATSRSPSKRSSATTSTSPPAATSPPPPSSARCWRWAPTASSSPSIGPSSRTRPAQSGWKACPSAPRTRSRSSAPTPKGSSSSNVYQGPPGRGL